MVITYLGKSAYITPFTLFANYLINISACLSSNRRGEVRRRNNIWRDPFTSHFHSDQSCTILFLSIVSKCRLLRTDVIPLKGCFNEDAQFHAALLCFPRVFSEPLYVQCQWNRGPLRHRKKKKLNASRRTRCVVAFRVLITSSQYKPNCSLTITCRRPKFIAT